MLLVHVVCGLVPGMKGYAGVLRLSSSTSVQLRVPPLLPCPACTNQSRPHGVSTLSVAFFTSFCIEIEPSEQVVWLWKSPARYCPLVPPAPTGSGTAPSAIAPSAAEIAIAIRLLLNPTFIDGAPGDMDGCKRRVSTRALSLYGADVKISLRLAPPTSRPRDTSITPPSAAPL